MRPLMKCRVCTMHTNNLNWSLSDAVAAVPSCLDGGDMAWRGAESG